MRDTNHRTIGANRPVITITSTVYDRRALDLNSSIPLINSLNHLTYLTSNSGKVRETVANDGALDRLVCILHDCHLKHNDLIELPNENDKLKNKRAVEISMEKKLALFAWKWTLAFQCLVLTGTRGSEAIRKKVVASGVIPVLATVLDNYLLYHSNYDHINEQYLKFDFKTLPTKKMYHFLRKDQTETYEEFLHSLVGKDTLALSEENEKLLDELTKPVMTIPTDFGKVWESLRDETTKDDPFFNSCFVDDYNIRPVISSPREFFMGRVIPKQDDIIWSLQLLAFISKYTYMKTQLQNVELVDSLSFRSIVNRVKKRLCGLYKTNGTTMNMPHYVQLGVPSPSDSEEISSEDDSMVDDSDCFLQELKSIAMKCKVNDQQKKSTNKLCEAINPFNYFNINIPKCNSSKRAKVNESLKRRISEKWGYKNLPMELDDETWKYVISKEYIDLFPLVEKFTVTTEHPHDVIYWSSVIMRNSCRKNEVTGVRQCANFTCGKWEEYPRQFAKCRRCKRTKYCSRKCQLKAWTYHRYWCHEVDTGTKASVANTEACSVNAEGTPAEDITATTATTISTTTTANASISNTDNTVHSASTRLNNTNALESR